MRIATVLRTGGEYTPAHVYAIKRMLNRHLPEHEFICLTDAASIPWRVPLEHDWPGAWAKLELCRPDITGPLLYLDLDMVVTGDLTPLAQPIPRSIVLRDFYRGQRDRGAVQSALMYLTENDRAAVWQEWTENEAHHRRTSKHWDQGVFERVLRDRALRWQDTHAGMVVGYKSHIRGNGGPPEDCRVVVFHGRPRPWESGEPWAEAAFR